MMPLVLRIEPMLQLKVLRKSLPEREGNALQDS
jgi:hypothetical protein